ncbi:glutaminyl-peptide cyclotransferase [Haloactinomyces albus]|uniref:Glutaminyl-peptide cyclotransferase n=2 Tax=Haloactinomyces albus TaxID=1352928 RepID=A0AAE4CL76_9ACTN|nr:glutaminyl-peptide cyclotransferase [Haloactinomyces albus]MDR7301509.1 glutaminyl-peptide cyclotransferase [Haloactinomyces albus]
MTVLVLGMAQCGTPQVPAEQHGQGDREQTEQGIGHAGSVSHLRADVTRVRAHDRSAFTQGLELAGGILYEGTGKHGQSVLRAVDPHTGRVLQEAHLPQEFFGEGITVVGDRIWQLTWRSGVAILRDRASLTEIDRMRYEGEGWGLCHDGNRLVMSDGSARLTFRDPETFAPTGGITVRLGGEPVEELNELECADGSIWANVWKSHRILRIDPASGRVTAVVDASGLLPPEQRAQAGVLNGIAAVEGTDEFLLTGKNWPHLYRVRFVPA